MRAPLAWRWAARDLRGGLAGFRLLIACLALGVAAIAAAGSTAQAFRAGLAANAREILGGDIAVSVSERPFTARERAIIGARGEADYAAAAQAMASAPSGERTLVELRGVSEGYPLVGHVGLAGGVDPRLALAPIRDGRGGAAWGAAVEASLLRRLGLRLGDRLTIGEIPAVVGAVLVSEPDRLSRGFALGPRVLTRLRPVEASGLLAGGLPFGETARLVLPPGARIPRVKAELRRALGVKPGSGLRVRDARQASPAAGRLIDQLEYFLGFIGLASLLAGGIGVRGAVRAFLERRAGVMATMKALGASGGLVRDICLIEIAAMAGLGIAIGLALGAAVPPLIGRAAGSAFPDLPVPALFALYPVPLARAAAFGALAAVAFALPPLARARSASPAGLFRGEAGRGVPVGAELAGALLAALALAVLAVRTAPTPVLAMVMIASVVFAFALLWLLGWGLGRLVGRLGAVGRGPARIGLAQLVGRPGAARDATAALGLGVALLTAVVLIQSSLIAEVSVQGPRDAPSVVFTGIPANRAASFDSAVARAFGRRLEPDMYQRFPFATGRLVGIRGQPVARQRIDAADRWAWDSDIGISAIGPEPPRAGVIAGRWWPADGGGIPEVALSLDAARGERVKVGDTVTLSVLGASIEAKVAALRKIDLAGFGADFPVVIDAAALAGANLDQVAIAKASPVATRRATAALGLDFPMVGIIDVREALHTVADLFDRLSLAIRAAASVCALAGVLVLVGVIAAGAPARAREAASLQALGADRRQIVTIYLVEFAAVGLIAGLAGVALGALAAWPVVTLVFEADWSLDRSGVAALAGGAMGLAGLGGVAAAFLALRGSPARLLRAG